MSEVEFPEGQRPEIKLPESPYARNKRKADLTLLDTDFLKGVADVMADGANRPGRERDSWKDLSLDQALTRCASAYRHLMDVHDGEYYDHDSGLQNAYHLAANAMILAFHVKKAGK